MDIVSVGGIPDLMRPFLCDAMYAGSGGPMKSMVVWLTLLLVATPALGLCTFYTDPKFPTLTPEVLSAEIDISLTDGYAVVEIQKIFRNPDARTTQVGDIIFPLPSQDAFITALALTVDGVVHEANVVDRQQAREQFSQAVDEKRDASLLEHLGGSQYALRVTLPPQETRTLMVRYEQPIVRDQGGFTYRYPLTEEALSNPQELSLRLTANSAANYSSFATNLGDLSRPNGREAVVVFEAGGAKDLQTDLVVRYDGAGGSLFSKDAAGNFVLRLQPKAVADQPLPQDIVVLVDASGSMKGQEDAVLESVQQILGELGPSDRVQVAVFRDKVSPLNEFETLGATARAKLLGRLADTPMQGSTNLAGALDTASVLLAKGRPNAQGVILLVSDGRATNGPTAGHHIGHDFAARDAGRSLVHAVQIGEATSNPVRFDPWGRSIVGAEPALTTLTRSLGGIAAPAAETPRLAELISGPGRVLLRNVTIEVEGATNVTPSRLPLLMEGSEILLTGQATRETLRVVLRGHGADGLNTLIFESNAATMDEMSGRIGALVRLRTALEAINVNGGSKANIDAVKQLAGQYGYVTPYTSLLVDLPASKFAADTARTNVGTSGATAPPTTTATWTGTTAWATTTTSPMTRTVTETGGPGVGGYASSTPAQPTKTELARQATEHLMQAEQVRSDEYDRIVFLDSAEHKALTDGAYTWIAQYGQGVGLLLAEGSIIAVAAAEPAQSSTTLERRGGTEEDLVQTPAISVAILLVLLASMLYIERRVRQ
jgi:Ca-activated chloride channel homolog